MANSIAGVKISIAGGTDEERDRLLDAIMFAMVEQGISIENMRQWEGPAD